MTNAQFLVAKYIPDLQRFEPRNVGIIVWTPDGLAAQFLAEYPERPGEVDGRRKPDFFQSLNAYRQWVRFWRKTIDQAEERMINGVTRRAGPEVLEKLKASSKGNFVLVDGGFLLDPVPAYELPKLVGQLFQKLVFQKLVGTHEAAVLAEGPSLEQRCNHIFDTLPLPPEVKLLHDYAIPCQIGDMERQFRFDYVLKNGSVQGVYDQFPLPHWKKVRHTNAFWSRVDAAAFKFDKVIEENVTNRAHTAALILAEEEDYSDPDIGKAIDLLNSVTHIVNVADMPRAAQVMERLAVTEH